MREEEMLQKYGPVIPKDSTYVKNEHSICEMVSITVQVACSLWHAAVCKHKTL
jgi:hypothetical protein